MRPRDRDPALPPGLGGGTFPEGADSGQEPDLARAERLLAIRQMIDDGSYETTERLEGAVSSFLSVVGE